jgi:hypothetical protein
MCEVAPVPVEDTKLFDETIRVVHEVFTPGGIEDEIKRVIQSGVKAKPEVVAALAYFLLRSRHTEDFVPLQLAAGKFLVSLEAVEKAKQEYEKQL